MASRQRCGSRKPRTSFAGWLAKSGKMYITSPVIRRLFKPSSLAAIFSIFVLGTICTSTKAATIVVAAGGDLQAAINTATCGDVVLLQAGATWDGTFLYSHNCPDSNRITIRSSGYASLPT